MRWNKPTRALLCFALAQAGLAANAQTNGGRDAETVSIKLVPGLTMPVGAADSAAFKPGVTADVVAEFRIPEAPLVYVPVTVGYSLVPINSSSVDLNLMLISAGGGLGLDWNPLRRLHLGAYTRFGYTFGVIPDPDSQLEASVVNPVNTGHTWNLHAGAFVQFKAWPTLSVGIDAGYRLHAGLSQGLAAGVGATYYIRPRRLPGFVPERPALEYLELADVTLEPVFPVFYKYYDEKPLGSVTLHNTGRKAIEKITVSFFVKEFMDNPKLCGTLESLRPGESADVPLYGLFTSRVLGISESTKVSANLVVEAQFDGAQYRNDSVQSLRVHDRNAMTWGDDRRAAAFVTMKDPTVLKLSKFVAGQIKGRATAALNSNFLQAFGLLEALRLYEISYVVDPSSPYKELSEQPLAVDYLQFPVQTLEYKAGDCDDLSILYSALLESVGVQTVFVTIPGHIFMALDLDLDPREARKQFSHPENLIVLEGRTWLPVEVTLLRGGFLTAWQEGAKQWREASGKQQAGFHPIHEAWKLYEPVGFASEAMDIALPSGDALVGAFMAGVGRFVDQEIFPQVEAYRRRIASANDPSKDLNGLGVLYARYGKYAEAREQFNRVLTRQEYVPALMNLGNLLFLEKDYQGALKIYERAHNRDETNAAAVLHLARTHHELENYSFVRQFYGLLKRMDSPLAERFAYLELRQEELARAANIAAQREVMLWEE